MFNLAKLDALTVQLLAVSVRSKIRAAVLRIKVYLHLAVFPTHVHHLSAGSVLDEVPSAIKASTGVSGNTSPFGIFDESQCSLLRIIEVTSTKDRAFDEQLSLASDGH
jgi:hypothetical protein